MPSQVSSQLAQKHITRNGGGGVPPYRRDPEDAFLKTINDSTKAWLTQYTPFRENWQSFLTTI